jgi:O-antigen/teichoic acid export membrane protein
MSGDTGELGAIRRDADPLPMPRNCAPAKPSSQAATAIPSETKTSRPVRAAPSNVGLHRRLAFGFGAQALTLVVLMIERIIMVPLYLAAWGVALYEDWLFLGAIAGFLRLLDLGMEWHFGNALRLSLAAGRHDLFHRSLAVGIGCYFAVMAVAGAALTVMILILLPGGVIETAVLSSDTAKLVLWIFLIQRLLLMPRTFITGLYSAHGEFSRGENMFTLFTTGQSFVIIALLLFKASPVVVAVVGLISIFFTCWMPLLGDLRRRYPEVQYSIAMPTGSELRKIGKNAGYYFLTNSAEILLNSGPVVLLGMLSREPGGILIFTIARTLTGIARQIAIQFARSSAIEMARQTAQGDWSGLRKLHTTTGRTISAMTGLLCGLILSGAEPILEIWTGGRVTFDPLIVLTFVCGVLFVGPAQSNVTLLQLGNVPRPLAISSFVRVALVCLLMFTLVPMFGALGAAVALSFAETISFGVLASHWANRRYGLRANHYALLSFSTQAACLVLGAGVGVALQHFLEVTTIQELALFIALWGAVVVVPAFFMAFPITERNRVYSFLKRQLPSFRPS